MQRIKDALLNYGVHVTTEDVNIRLHSLRIYYTKERNKKELSIRSGAGADEASKPKWIYFPILEFLNGNLQPRNKQPSRIRL